MAGSARRCALGEPWFLVAVAVLALNDHVLKADHPGWVTGKISDVAGVVVVGATAAALVGRRTAIAGTALGFIALKTAPGVAELAAPVLGGVTRRDGTDLVALLALVPLALLLGRRDRGVCAVPSVGTRSTTAPLSRTASSDPHPSGSAGRRARRLAASMLPILGAASALVVTTATSCSPDPAVVRVIPQGSSTYAYVDRGYEGDRWARSDDGGRSWRRSDAPSSVDPDAYAGIPTTTTTTSTTTTTTEPLGDPTQDSTTTTTTDRDDGTPYDERPLGPSESCGATACYRIVDGRTVQRADVGSERWVTELTLTSSDREHISTGCSGSQKGVLTSIAAGDGTSAVASLGAVGVLARNDDGTWNRHRVLDADQDSLANSFVTSWTFWALVSTFPLGMAGAWVLGRPRTTLRIIALIVIPVGILAVFGWVFSVAIILGEGPRVSRHHLLAVAVILVLGLGLALRSRDGVAPSVDGPSGETWPPRDRRPNPPARP